MNLVRLIDYLRERLNAVIVGCCVFLGLLAVLDIVRWYAARGHHEAPAAGGHAAAAEASHGLLQSLYHVAETVPVFWSLFGFVACTVIIFFSKKFGHLKVGTGTEIMAREDYYND